MSKSRHSGGTPAATEHGTERSYIIGFVLSLIFTIIPYMLVRHGWHVGNVLITIILAIAVLQMLIQIIFFLHLGRERKPRWQLYFLIGTVVGILTVVVGSIFIMAHLRHNMDPMEVAQKLSQDEGIAQVEGSRTGACPTIKAEHVVTINDGAANPAHVDAAYCDALIFTAADDTTHEIGFGTHPEHLPYAGQDDLIVTKGHGQMVILSQTGSYKFHDHLDPLISGTFTVSQ